MYISAPVMHTVVDDTMLSVCPSGNIVVGDDAGGRAGGDEALHA